MSPLTNWPSLAMLIHVFLIFTRTVHKPTLQIISASLIKTDKNIPENCRSSSQQIPEEFLQNMGVYLKEIYKPGKQTGNQKQQCSAKPEYK